MFTSVSRFPTYNYGEFTIYVTTDEDVVLTKGNVAKSNVYCRIQSACMPSTVLNYNGCPCKQQIDDALDEISKRGQGIFIYLAGQEGRGNGLAVKIRALVNKLAGMNTYQAVEALGLPADVRTYEMVPQILDALGVQSVQLHSSNMDKHTVVKEWAAQNERD